MQYLYEESAGAAEIRLTGEQHRYLFRVRRHRTGERLGLRNLKNRVFYTYRIEHIDKKEALLRLEDARELQVEAGRSLHIGWCRIDPRMIEKSLPSLNEMGVRRVTFIECDRSQKNFRLDLHRLEKILLNSSQQCGRSTRMELGVAKNLADFLEANPESWLLDFSQHSLEERKREIGSILVGPEGGFSEEERSRVARERIVGLETPMILRSESAVCAAASKILL